MAFILIKLRVEGEDFFLLRQHEKWGDWSVVGGHIEPGEETDWWSAAVREADEELDPLTHSIDFDVFPLGDKAVCWGPVPSRSAKGIPTRYRAQYYFLKLKRKPGDALAKLSVDAYRLISQSRLESLFATPAGVSDTLVRAKDAVKGGLSAVPLAWPENLHRDAVPITEWNDQETTTASAPTD